MFFQSRNFHASSLFKVSKILKFFDKTALENCGFISKSLKGLCLLFSITGSNFLLSHTLMILDGQILVILKYPLTYGRYSMFVNSIYIWNHLQSCHHNVIFHQLRGNKLKEILISFFLNRYN